MYTYKLGGLLITDELYHDDLDAMTFGRKDQNELMHYGIKGQSWGKRRFQNEDGSLTAAGRNRYDVGNPKQGVTAYSDTGGRGGSGVNYNRTSGTGRPSTSQPAARVAPKPQSRGTGVQSVNKSVAARANSGKKAADNLFGRIGNLATNAAKDVGKAATNAYNGASRAVNNAADWVGDRAQDVGNAVTSAAQDVKDWYTGDKAAREAQRYDNVVQNFEQNGERNINEGVNTISRGINAPDSAYDLESGKKLSGKLIDEGVKQRNLGYDQHDIARQYGQKADEAQARYENAPRQLLNAAGNWIGDRVSDAGNAVGNALKPGINAVGNAVRDAGNWVGDTAKNIYDDVDYRLYSLGQDIAQPAKDRAYQDFLDRTAKDRETYDREFPTGDMTAARYAGARIDDEFHKYQKESNKIRQNPIGSAINNVGRSIGEGVQKAGDWASNAASDVRDWGAGALDKGRQAFESLFGRSEPPVPTLSDPNPQIETETILRENIIPEQRITEQRVPEQRITENRIEEQRIAEKQAPGGFNSRPLTKEENEIELKRVNDRLNNIDDYYDHLRANNNPQWSNYTKQDIIDLLAKDRDRYQNNINQQQEAERAQALSDKPDGVSDEYWRDYTSNGGTRESYDREMKNRKSSAVPLSSDKDYAAEQERLRNISAQQDRNGFRVEEVNAPVGTVDTSRPYHFTLDPVSGQTVVVYDDEKRR